MEELDVRDHQYVTLFSIKLACMQQVRQVNCSASQIICNQDTVRYPSCISLRHVVILTSELGISVGHIYPLTVIQSLVYFLFILQVVFSSDLMSPVLPVGSISLPLREAHTE